MNITVLGAGAMGCLFGGRLAEAGHQAVLVDIRAEQVEAIHHDGLRIEDDEGERTVRLPARLANDEPGGPCELVLLLTKAHHSDAALVASAAIFGPDTWCSRSRTAWAWWSTSASACIQAASWHHDLAERPGGAGTGAHPRHGRHARWAAAGRGRRRGGHLGRPAQGNRGRSGVGAGDHRHGVREHCDHQPSMLQDVRAGRATEIDHVNGAVAREASALGMEVPVTATLWRLVRVRERGYLAARDDA